MVRYNLVVQYVCSVRFLLLQSHERLCVAGSSAPARYGRERRSLAFLLRHDCGSQNMGVWVAKSVEWTAIAYACHALHCVQVHVDFSCYAMGHSDAAQRQPSATCQLASNASLAVCHGVWAPCSTGVFLIKGTPGCDLIFPATSKLAPGP